MSKWQFTKGLHEVGNGLWAYLQPDGGWCLSNAGLIVDGDQSLLVDTLTDVPLTREMLKTMERATPAASKIGTVVNTHAHPDHTAGNSLLEGAEIIASAAAAEEMKRFGDPESPIAKMLSNWQDFGEGGAYLNEVMGSKFDLANSPMVLPTRTFEQTLDLKVGDKDLHLINVGPAHTAGDVLAYLPKDRTIFTGDILFNQVHPLISEHYKAWIAACDYILGLDVEVVVPGHGPISDKSGVQNLKDYLLYFEEESRKRFEAGMDLETAVEDISLGAFRGWVDEERIMNNTATFYRAFGGATPPPLEIFGMAGRYRRKHAGHGHDAHA